MPENVNTRKTAPAKARSKSALVAYLAERHELPRPKVKALLEDIAATAVGDLKRKDVGAFVLPDLVKLKVVRKAATKQKEGINPFTKQPMTFAAKPARDTIKAVLPKSLRGSI